MSVNNLPIAKAKSLTHGPLDASLVPGSGKLDPLYYIDKILDHRDKSGKREFLVQWWKSPASKNEWVPEYNFQGAIPNYVKANKTSTKRKSLEPPEATRRSKRQRRIAASEPKEDEYKNNHTAEPKVVRTRRSQRKTMNRSMDFAEESDEDSSSGTVRRKTKKRAVSKKSPTGYTMIEAALLCLEGEGREMHAREIAKVCIQEGWINKTKTPHNSITAALNGHIKKYGPKSSFIKAGPNIFALSPLHKRKMKSKQLKNAKSTKSGSSTKSKKKSSVDDDGEFSVPGVKVDKKSGTPKTTRSSASATRKNTRRKFLPTPGNAKKSTDSKSDQLKKTNAKTTKNNNHAYSGFGHDKTDLSRSLRSSLLQRTTRSSAKNKLSTGLSNHLIQNSSVTNGAGRAVDSVPRSSTPFSQISSPFFSNASAGANFPSHPPIGAEIKITEPPPELGFNVNNFNGSFLDQPFDQQMAQELAEQSYDADIPEFKRDVCLGLGCGVWVEYPSEAQMIQCPQCNTVMEIDRGSGSLVMTNQQAHTNHKSLIGDMDHPSLGI